MIPFDFLSPVDILASLVISNTICQQMLAMWNEHPNWMNVQQAPNSTSHFLNF
jgi:hypothetical protein